MRIKTIQTSNKNFILKYFRCRDGKRTETRIGMEGICITHSCIPLYTVYMQHIMAHSGGMQEYFRCRDGKGQKQELGWRVSVLPIPAFHHCEPLCVACTQCTVECRNG